jgi:hypothetical protein
MVTRKEPVDAWNEYGDEQEPGQLMNKAHPAHDPGARTVRYQKGAVHISPGDCQQHQ